MITRADSPSIIILCVSIVLLEIFVFNTKRDCLQELHEYSVFHGDFGHMIVHLAAQCTALYQSSCIACVVFE